MSQLIRTTILFGALTGLFLLVGNILGGQEGMFMGLVVAVVMNFGSYYFSDKIVLAQYGAKEADKLIYADLYSSIDKLATKSSLPMPKVYVLDIPTPNAFATGRDQKHAVVAVSKSLMQILNQAELEGVLAHELGHIKNGDMLISTVAASLAGAISYLANFAFYFGGSRSRDNDRGANPIALLAVALVTPIVATLLHMAISRSREFVADEYAGNLTGTPTALSSALRKISGISTRSPLRVDASHASSAHLFIINPFDRSLLNKLFSTHPPLFERIAKLDSMQVR